MKGLLHHDVTVYVGSTIDRYGRETFTSPVTTKARFVKKTRRILSPQGEDIVSEADCDFINNNGVLNSLAVGSRLLHDGVNYRIVQLDESKDNAGTHHHFSTRLQRWQV